MKQIQKSSNEEPNVLKRLYKQPRIEVIVLDKQVPLLATSTLSSPNPGSVDEEDW